MQINKINNNETSFGIKFSNKNAWNKDVLKAFENSKLIKSIDEKYPKATVEYAKVSEEESFGNSEIIHTLIMDIKLAKDKFFRWHLSSHRENVPEKELIKELEDLSLTKVELDSVEKLMPLSTIEITSIKQNPIAAFFKKLFS